MKNKYRIVQIVGVSTAISAMVLSLFIPSVSSFSLPKQENGDMVMHMTPEMVIGQSFIPYAKKITSVELYLQVMNHIEEGTITVAISNEKSTSNWEWLTWDTFPISDISTYTRWHEFNLYPDLFVDPLNEYWLIAKFDYRYSLYNETRAWYNSRDGYDEGEGWLYYGDWMPIGDWTFRVHTSEQISFPIADFAYSPQGPQVDEIIAFDGTSSYDPDGAIETYEWSFGDGGTASGAIASRSYDNAGSYSVSLTVVDDDGCSNKTTRIVGIESPPSPHKPTARMDISVDHMGVTLDASGSSDPDNDITDYIWDFGDGSSGNGIVVTHIYKETGTYTVTLIVEDSEGNIDTATEDVNIVKPMNWMLIVGIIGMCVIIIAITIIIIAQLRKRKKGHR